jgi:hypothetical protein
MLVILRTLISTEMLLTQSMKDSVEMDLLYIQIHRNQATRNATKFLIMLPTSVLMLVCSQTSQVRKCKCIQLLFLTQELEQVQWLQSVQPKSI